VEQNELFLVISTVNFLFSPIPLGTKFTYNLNVMKHEGRINLLNNIVTFINDYRRGLDC
jgi:hypothetical protein